MIRRHFLWAAGAAILLMTGSAEAAKPVPAALQVPAGYKPVLSAEAKGVQIYKSAADTDGHFKWVFEAPLAQLSDRHGKLALYHYAGPSWESLDGSKIARDTAVPVVQGPAAHPATDVPWLLAKVTPDAAPGVLAKVDYVQRLDTHGGQAPAAAPTRADTRVGVPYTATYVFFAKAE
jgi:hypothetical protein